MVTPKLGVNAHLLNGGKASSPDDAATFQICRQNGLKVMRLNIGIASANAPWLATRLRTLIDLGKQNGVELMLMLSPTVNQVLLPLDQIGPLVTKLAQIAGPDVVRWELGNEVNLLVEGGRLYGTGLTAEEFNTPLMHQWADAMKAMGAALAAANPKSAGWPYRIVVNTTSTNFGFLDFLIDKDGIYGTGLHFDRIDYHSYERIGFDYTRFSRVGAPPFNMFDKLRSYNKSIIFGEVNAGEIYSVDDPALAAKSMSLLVKQILANPVDIDCILIYELFDEPTQPPPEDRFGLMKNLTTEKPAMAALRQLTLGSTGGGSMASSYDSLWEQFEPVLNDTVDDVLADRVLYSLDGVNYDVQPAFVIQEVSGETDIAPLDDDFAVRNRIKISKSIIELPAKQHRIRHPKLGDGTFRPGNSVPQTMGRYWLFDLQRAA